MLPSSNQILEYLGRDGLSPYAQWFDSLNSQAAVKVAIAVTRMGEGNLSNVKGVGFGVFEYRIDFGPGYRIYFGKDGERIVILLGGGSKKRQQQDIRNAISRWRDYKDRKDKGKTHGFDERL